MHMAKAFIAAALLAAALIAAVVVPTALTRGTFGFDAWPEATAAKAHDEAVAIGEPPNRRRAIAHAEPREQRGAAERRSGDVPAPSTGTPSLPEAVVRAEPPAARDGAEQPRRDGREHEAPAPAAEVPSTPVQDVAQGDELAPQDAPEIEARPVVEAVPEVVEELPPVTPPGWGVHPRDGWKHGGPPPWAGRGHRDDKN
jgi:hypothetical protein